MPEEHKKDIMVKLVCGSVAGLLGQTFTYPLDVVRRQMQVRLMMSKKKMNSREFLVIAQNSHERAKETKLCGRLSDSWCQTAQVLSRVRWKH